VRLHPGIVGLATGALAWSSGLEGGAQRHPPQSPRPRRARLHPYEDRLLPHPLPQAHQGQTIFRTRRRRRGGRRRRCSGGAWRLPLAQVGQEVLKSVSLDAPRKVSPHNLKASRFCLTVVPVTVAHVATRSQHKGGISPCVREPSS
jgi:hypothetical protein